MLERIVAGIVVGLVAWLEKRKALQAADVDAAFLRRTGDSLRVWLQQDRDRRRRVADARGESDWHSPPED
jgi:hypothetical protein